MKKRIVRPRIGSLQITVVGTMSLRPNGDRDRERHPCWKYVVRLVRTGRGGMDLAEFDQFDSFWTCIRGTKAHVEEEAIKFASKLCDMLDRKPRITLIEYEPEPVPTDGMRLTQSRQIEP